MSRTVEHRTYQRSACVVFRKTDEHFGGLSNMAGGYLLHVNGVRILTAEALYQACRFPHVPEVQRLIIDQPSPMTAKMKSKPHRKQSRSDWDEVNIKVMRWTLRVKLAQNWRKFGNLLQETGDRPIVEESTKDAFWGAKPVNDDTLVGSNVLGRLLMELREQMRSDLAALLQVAPPSLPGFLLFNNPVETIIAEVSSRELIERPPASPRADRTLWDLGDDIAPQVEPLKPTQPEPVRTSEWSASVIPKACKRLAEVDFPIAKVSAHSAREKSIRHGHPSTLHLWWARRPLAACRSMLMALLLPDPCDPHCPAAFKQAARGILLDFAGRPGRWDDDLKTDAGLRHAMLHEFIADFANWDNAANPAYLKTARALVKAAHGDEPPLVVDPFAGGGSIPLEALRIGCDSFASDLNPVACMINKVLLEDIPRHGPKLADELRRVGAEIKKQAEAELAEFYPPDSDGARPIAYLWARTVRCEQPNCGCEIPLTRSFWLCKKSERPRALRMVVEEKRGHPQLSLEMFEPESDGDVAGPTVSRAKATCPACRRVLGADRVRAQLFQQHGGADVQFDDSGKRIGGALLLAIVLLRPGESGRAYRVARDRDYAQIHKSQEKLRRIVETWRSSGAKGAIPIPDEPTPVGGGRGAGRAFSLQMYGMNSWSDLFNARQRLALYEFAKHIGQLREFAPALMLAHGKLADLANATCPWEPIAECPRNVLSNGRIKTAWSFAEGVTVSESSASFAVCLENLCAGIASVGALPHAATVQQAPAQTSPLPDASCAVWFTDPPYYDAIPYAGLSDFFFVWIKRALPNNPLARDPFDSKNPLTPKNLEIVQDEVQSCNGRPKDGASFEDAMAEAFAEGRRRLRPDGIASIVFAHKTTEGWEALLGGLVRGGLTIVGSWPITTEMAHRLRARESAALAASIHLVCRPREEDAGVGDWGEIIRELPKRIGDWMERLSSEGIRGADLVFACIGPALELFSKYARVETPDGEEVGLAANDKARGEPARRGFLSYVWEFAGRTALNQVLGSAESRARNGAAGALEEDARLTALFLWTLQATEAATNDKGAKKAAAEDEEGAEAGDEDDDTGEDTATKKGKKKAGLSLIYDVARRFAQPLGIHLDVWEGRIIETAKGIVRLLPVGERAKQLFGEDGAAAVVRKFDTAKKPSPQMMLDFMAEHQAAAVPEVKGRGRKKASAEASAESLRAKREATTLDRVHAAMLLQSSGASNALRALLEAEVQRSPDFLRLANALSALYPRDSEEKRLLDAMLLAVPR